MTFAVLTSWGCAEGERQVIVVTGVFSPEWKVTAPGFLSLVLRCLLENQSGAAWWQALLGSHLVLHPSSAGWKPH